MATGPAVDGVVLAGGRATRLPGKPLLELHGTPLVLHPVAAMRVAGLAPTVVGKQGDGALRAVVEEAGCAWLTEPDEPVHPLFGIAFALAELRRPAVVCAADMPFVSAGLLTALATHGEDASVVALEVDAILQPLLARYSPDVGGMLHEAALVGASATGTLRALGKRLRVLGEGEMAAFGDPARLIGDVDDAAGLAAARARRDRP